MLSYRTVLLAQTGICSESTPHLSLASSTVRIYTYQKPWITGNIRTELKGRAAAFKERDSKPEAYKKSPMPSDEPTNR